MVLLFAFRWLRSNPGMVSEQVGNQANTYAPTTSH